MEVPSSSKPMRVIIDTDPGVDDMMALVLALVSPEIRVEGLTIVMGNNNDQDLLAKNACLALNITSQADGSIPVVTGASKPLERPYGGQSGIEVHGTNALGNAPYPAPFTEENLSLAPLEHKHQSAAHFLSSHCAENQGEITIIALGPLTNVASAILLDKELSNNVKRVILMGGTVDGRGNITPAAEANVHNDPEAAKLVFQTFGDITMVGLNATRQMSLSEEFRKELSLGSRVGEYFKAITEHYCKVIRGWKGEPVINDATAILAALRPDLFEFSLCCIDVETKGDLTVGATIADWTGHWHKTRKAQTRVAMKVQEQKLKQFYLARMAEHKWPDTVPTL
jgi:inosine-uridine nucleoside N-ribohydrolase